jgi:hypothetical protein
MKILYLIFPLLLLGCLKRDNLGEIFLKKIDQFNHLTLQTEDDKCGEWGGDIQKIVFYRKDFESELLADYYKITQLDCDSLADGEPRLDTLITNKLKVNNVGTIILDAISELAVFQLTKEQSFANHGILNEVFLSDSSLIMSDFNYNKWKAFETLKKELLANKH